MLFSKTLSENTLLDRLIGEPSKAHEKTNGNTPMKLKALTALFLCGVLALAGGLLAFAGEQEAPAGELPAASVPEVPSLPAEAPEKAPEEAPEEAPVPEDEPLPPIEAYTPDLVLLSSTAWDDVLGKCVTGEFTSIGDALRALNAPYPLYYPAADGGHLQTYGGGVLILLNNPVMVMDPAKGCSTTYQSIQMNYATASIQNVKITLGYAPDLSAEAYDEVYLSHGNTFYLRGCTNLVNGNSFCTLTGVVEGCLYSVVAYDPEAAKQMIDSLIQA